LGCLITQAVINLEGVELEHFSILMEMPRQQALPGATAPRQVQARA